MGRSSKRADRRTPSAATAAAAILLLCATPARAYLDPGAGSMLVQALIGAVAGGLMALKLYWRRLLARLGRKASGPRR